MSLCDHCLDPGRCCKHIAFFADGEEVAFWLDESIDDQLRANFHADDKDRPQPFVIKEVVNTAKSEDGREYAKMVFTCSKLLPNGRCGIYENRPWLCREFKEGEEPLCVHYRGAEGGEG